MRFYVLLIPILLTACDSDVPTSGATIDGSLARTNAAELTGYFRQSLINGIGKSLYSDAGREDATDTEEDAVAAPGQESSFDSAAGFSLTQLQESGVDEADVLKTDGNFVYRILGSEGVQGHSQGHSTANAIGVFKLTNEARNIAGVTRIASPSDRPFTAMYLDAARDQLIALQAQTEPVWSNWFAPQYFMEDEVGVAIFDVSNGANPTLTRHLEFDGALITSRKIDSTLYLVLRHFPQPHPWHPYVYSDAQRAENQQTLGTLQAADFLPRLRSGGTEGQPLVSANDCYINHSTSAAADVITLVALDLADAENAPQTQCYVGHSEAVYASKNALYLASTRWDYDWRDPQSSYSTQTTTDIHKFAFTSAGFEYRGSAEVGGHLGFDQNRKSFRFSEHNDHLRVMTINEQRPWALAVDTPSPETQVVTNAAAAETTPSSSDRTPASHSPVMLSILRESASAASLQLVAQLPNRKRPTPIGKDGEQLYASRYIGDRGYAVTFRVTDPLYVLDLSNPLDPFIAGELEIAGYSDYLFALTEALLLGVGKDAVADESGWGDQRGAWYQGVKLSLIDVSDPANPRETDTRIIGKRGTESPALGDHHAISLLSSTDGIRIALPVRLHDTLPGYGHSGEPWQYYEHTHTGLYRFSVPAGSTLFATDSPAPLVAAGPAQEGEAEDFRFDRGLLVKEAVHYFDANRVLSQDWAGLEEPDWLP